MMTELFNRYGELIKKASELGKNIIVDEELLLKSELETEKAALFESHLFQNAKDNEPEKRLARNDDERRLIRKTVQLLPLHEDRRIALKTDKLLLQETLMRIQLLERELIYKMQNIGKEE